MALFTPSASPAVTVKEIDLTGVVPNVQTSTGAIVGSFGWGPIGVPTLISDETGLVSTFSSPDSSNTADFHSAAYFLRYSNSLHVVREAEDSTGVSALNALANNTVLGSLTPTLYKNETAFDAATIDSGDGAFIAKYAGKLGNSLGVSVFGSVIGDDSATRKTEFTAWKYSGSFDGVTGTSKFAKSLTAKNDELHVVVYDNQGTITGTQGTVLETFPYLSTIKNAKNADGTSNYYKDVLKSQSAWIYAGVPHKDSGTVTTGDFGSSLLNGEQSLWGEVAVFDSSGTQDFGSPRAYTGQRDWSIFGW